MRRPRLRFRVRSMMVAVAIAGVVVAFTKYLCIDSRPVDLLAAAIGALDGEYTVYADGYSESKFRSIRIGMTVRQVEEIMGPPLTKGLWQAPNGSGPITPGVDPIDEIWHYARGGKHVQLRTASHWQRAVLFRNTVVWGTDSTYYIDRTSASFD
jgi:hypothetical protein